MNSGLVAASVTRFAELHEHVDANYYGGAFENTAHDIADVDFWNIVQDSIDHWLRNGRPSQTYKKSWDLTTIPAKEILAEARTRSEALTDTPQTAAAGLMLASSLCSPRIAKLATTRRNLLLMKLLQLPPEH